MSPSYHPELTITCRVCGSPITIHNRHAPDRGMISEPRACPACDAVIRSAPPLDIGIARSLILTIAGAPAEVEEHGTAEQFFAEYTICEADVDKLLALAQQMDLTRWHADRPHLPSMAKIRGLAASGELAAVLEKAAATAKRRYREEWARHLGIRAARRHS